MLATLYSGVPSLYPALLMSAPNSISARTIASSPFSAATCSIVAPSYQFSLASLLTSAPASISARTSLSLPMSATIYRTVLSSSNKASRL